MLHPRRQGKCAPELQNHLGAARPIGWGRLSQCISEQGPTSRQRALVAACPPARSPSCDLMDKEVPALRQGPTVEVWSLRISPWGQPTFSPPAVPSLLGPRSPAQSIPKSTPPCLSSYAVNFPPASPGARLPGPAGPQRGAAGGSYLRSRGFVEPLPLAGLSPRSGPRSSAPPPLQPLLALPLPGKPPPPPSHQPTSVAHMAPRSQWGTSPSRSPSRVPSPIPG